MIRIYPLRNYDIYYMRFCFKQEINKRDSQNKFALADIARANDCMLCTWYDGFANIIIVVTHTMSVSEAMYAFYWIANV